MPKLHYPKQPWCSSIAVLTSFVNESPLENRGGFAATQLFLFGSESTTKSKTCFGHAFWKNNQRINKHVQGHVLAMHQTYLRSSMSKTTETTYTKKTILKSYTSTCKVVL
jgi:hypothetical protein